MDLDADHEGTGNVLQYQECHVVKRHWDILSLNVPKANLYAHGATRVPPGCKSSTTEPDCAK